MKKLVGTIGMLVFLAGTGFAQNDVRKEAAPVQKMEFKEKRHKDMMAEIPNLTEEQKSQLKAIKEEGRQKTEPQRKELKAVQDKLREMKMAENPNQQEINKMIDKSALLRAEMEKSKTAQQLKARQVLTPEQRVVLDSKMKERIANKEKRHMEHKQMQESK